MSLPDGRKKPGAIILTQYRHWTDKEKCYNNIAVYMLAHVDMR